MSSPDSTIPHSTLCVARTLLSTVYRFVAGVFCEYGAARCSAKWIIVSGRSSRIIWTKRSYSRARSRLTKRMGSRLERPFQVATRSSAGVIGVSDCAPRSTSILRRERLSTMTTSCPMSDRCSATGQPQKPSPPSTKIFFDLPSPPAEAAGACELGAATAAMLGAERTATVGRPPPTAERTAAPPDSPNKAMLEQSITIESAARKAR
mmetsp:Transcript_14550/g.48436  ORF Transcript_14550/g.48436 Transcript_14550/m.48436 type:complete len:207 (+) Transcript_14550:861-1481(+)